MDFKIKIDLLSQSIINDTPVKDKKKKKKDTENSKTKKTKKDKKYEIENESNQEQIIEEKKKKKYTKKPKESISEDNEKPKINTNSIISLTLPNVELSKTDGAQKLLNISKKKPRHWEQRWVLIPNVFEFTKEIWLKKWVLIDDNEEDTDNNVNFYLFFRIIFYSIIILTILNLIKKLHPKNINVILMSVGKYSSMQAP
jgi:hypothetical protein